MQGIGGQATAQLRHFKFALVRKLGAHCGASAPLYSFGTLTFTHELETSGWLDPFALLKFYSLSRLESRVQFLESVCVCVCVCHTPFQGALRLHTNSFSGRGPARDITTLDNTTPPLLNPSAGCFPGSPGFSQVLLR